MEKIEYRLGVEHGSSGPSPGLHPEIDPVITGSQFLEPRPNPFFLGTCYETDPVFRSRPCFGPDPIFLAKVSIDEVYLISIKS